MAKATETKERIIRAAREEFTQKGLSGARMKDIAEGAGINQALLHYHYKSKQALFDIVFQDQAMQMFNVIRKAVFSNEHPLNRIDELVEQEHEVMKAFPTLPLFVLYESFQNPEMINDFTRDKPFPMIMSRFLDDFKPLIEKGEIQDIDPRHLVINVMSMIMYPMIARPIVKILFNLDDEAYDAFIAERATGVAEFVRAALRPQA